MERFERFRFSVPAVPLRSGSGSVPGPPCNSFSWNYHSLQNYYSQLSLGGRFGYFLFFFCSGEGKGESEAPGGGGGNFLWKKFQERGGGLPCGSGRGGRGREGVCWERGGGKYFFSGPKCPPRSYS